MKRITFLVCGLMFVLANSAEARWRNRSNNMNGSYNTTYTQPAAAAPATANVAAANAAINNPTRPANDNADSSQVATASLTTSDTDAKEEKVKTVSYSTATAQGVANIMASRGVGFCDKTGPRTRGSSAENRVDSIHSRAARTFDTSRPAG